MANKRIKELLVLLSTLILAVVLLTVLNIFTSPLIEKNNQGAELEPLYRVMEDAKGFEKIDSIALPDTVKGLWKETSGKGYVVRSATNKGFTGNYIELTFAFTVDGYISGINIDSYPETREVGEEYPLSFIGADSTLSTVDLVASVTYSSLAIKNACSDAFNLLTSNNLVKEKEKSVDQKIEELIPVVFAASLDSYNMAHFTTFNSSLSFVKSAYLSSNKSGVCYWIVENDEDKLVVTNGYNTLSYTPDGTVTTLSQATSDALITEALSKIKNYSKNDIQKLTNMVKENSSVEKASLSTVFNNVSGIYEIENEDGKYYGFAVRPYGFGNETMVIYVVINEEGKIERFRANELIIEAEYFSSYTLNPDYSSLFIGLDSSWTGEEALISGATISTNAVKDAINDAFDAYSIIKGGNN